MPVLITPLKTCFRCSELLPLTAFYRHPQMADGTLNKCKECTKQDTKKNYKENRAQYSAYDRRRSVTPARRAQQLACQRRLRLKHPDKFKARNAVSSALRSGKIVRQPCIHCGSSDGVEAHHTDYSRPLDVVWACFPCHLQHEHGQTPTCRKRR